ncbi:MULTISPECIES: hypothetical protein [unclassified Chitinophaga]|uniref:hypothetical protein n=1 Tax=unclassified Chitinophaga TaxID=2619133 RepID=UPI0030104783
MKANIYFFLLLILFTSCKKDNIAYKSDFNKSYQAWINFKESSGNSYRYAIATSSWTGSSSETIITVKEGKVIQRSYIAKNLIPATNQLEIIEEWMEDESKLGSHERGATFRTLDEIYKEVKDKWLLKRDHADTYFESGNNGMISTCGFVEKGCQDDCFQGVHINFIEKI